MADAFPHDADASDAGYPVHRLYQGEPVPHLGRIPRSRWRQALRPLSHPARKSALSSVASPQEASQLLVLLAELEIEDGQRRRRLMATAERPPTIPAPAAAPRSLAGRQVNVRLAHSDFDRLANAAELLGSTPTQLARGFIITGANRLLYERRLQESEGED
jgi:hypothetical protein